MADDLEAFLRQAAQRRAQRQTPVQRPAAPAPPPAQRPTAPSPPPPQRPAAAPPLRTANAPPPVVAAQIVPARVVPTIEKPRVGTRVNTAEFQHRAEQLGEEVGLADEHMDAHIAQKFDHQVGSLDLGDAAPSGGSPTDAPCDASELIALLKDPKTLRQAVLLSEILNPPHFEI